MKYAHLENNTNKILGWYSDEIHSVIPTPNIEVSGEVWQEAININANCYEDGKFIVKDFRTDSEIAEQLQAQANAEAINLLNLSDWKVIRELERLMLAGTDLNLEREALRESVV